MIHATGTPSHDRHAVSCTTAFSSPFMRGDSPYGPTTKGEREPPVCERQFAANASAADLSPKGSQLLAGSERFCLFVRPQVRGVVGTLEIPASVVPNGESARRLLQGVDSESRAVGQRTIGVIPNQRSPKFSG